MCFVDLFYICCDFEVPSKVWYLNLYPIIFVVVVYNKISSCFNIKSKGSSSVDLLEKEICMTFQLLHLATSYVWFHQYSQKILDNQLGNLLLLVFYIFSLVLSLQIDVWCFVFRVNMFICVCSQMLSDYNLLLLHIFLL